MRLTSARLHDVVVSDWTARAVLRYWRLKNRYDCSLNVIRTSWRRTALTLVAHAMVLGLGFVLVVPMMSSRTAATRALARDYSGTALWTGALRPNSAQDARELLKASVLEEQPAPPAAEQAAAPAPTAVRPKPTPAPTPSTFTPPPGSGGDGLAAIYAVFGNSPGLSWALRVANCESHYNPLAVNRYSGASGLFQFMPSTWNANFPGQNIWDPVAQARGALVFYNAGRQSAWTCK
ncbi:MAG TPA: transglycosylase SLT domain-containing protein [Candidatus Dormibacteraeota bacterium]|nr:transglycosylase SLT domain-containing protein [Candidatus Dormibacteraeota bacterium]